MTVNTTTPIYDRGYFNNYIKLVISDDILATLTKQGLDTKAFLDTLTEEKGNHRYAPGKWTIKELIGHLCDAERIFAYRALRFARKDKTKLSSFEQDDYVAAADFNSQTLSDLTSELFLIRKSNMALFNTFNSDILEQRGFSGSAELSVKDVLYIIAGHQIHHMKVLHERYI